MKVYCSDFHTYFIVLSLASFVLSLVHRIRFFLSFLLLLSHFLFFTDSSITDSSSHPNFFSLFFVSKVLVLSSLFLLLIFTETFVSEALGSTLSDILCLGNSQRHLERKLLKDSFFASFALGWVITNGAGLASYTIDPLRRRMMMTSGEAVKYKSSFDAFSQILKNEGPKSFFKGAGVNILSAIAGAGVLAGFDKLQVLVLGKKYGSGGA